MGGDSDDSFSFLKTQNKNKKENWRRLEEEELKKKKKKKSFEKTKNLNSKLFLRSVVVVRSCGKRIARRTDIQI